MNQKIKKVKSVSWSLTRSLNDLSLLSSLLSKIHPAIPIFPRAPSHKAKLEIQTVLNYYLQHSFIINSLKFQLFFDLGNSRNSYNNNILETKLSFDLIFFKFT